MEAVCGGRQRLLPESGVVPVIVSETCLDANCLCASLSKPTKLAQGGSSAALALSTRAALKHVRVLSGAPCVLAKAQRRHQDESASIHDSP